MTIPQRLTFVTLGARSVARLRAFYAAWGWTENDGSSDEYTSYLAGSVRLALYSLADLRDEAARDAELPAPGTWNGVTLAINLASRDEVDALVDAALRAGADLITNGVDRAWGGYSAYVADPEGNRWELAWAPDLDLT
jgi:predicted lactoylglutathione lyase